MSYDKTILLLSVALLFIGTSCSDNSSKFDYGVDYKEEMRTFVKEIETFAHNQDSDFIIIPQNGHRLVSSTAEDDGEPVTSYLNAIDGLGQEDLYYGYENDNVATPVNESEYLEYFLDLGLEAGKTVLVTDYASTPSKMNDSYSKNTVKGYISFTASSRELDEIPSYPTTIRNENSGDILTLSDAQNFLYLIEPEHFPTKTDLFTALAATNYDIIIMDAFYDGELLSSIDLNQIRTKSNGGTRLLISYMSIGEAEDYRYYWDSSWRVGNPDWIIAENPDWEGNYKVTYWDNEWKQYIFGNSDSYLQKIIDSGFDGVYLDIVEGFEFFED